MADEEKVEEGAEAQEKPKKSGGNTGLLIGVIVGNLIFGALMVFLTHMFFFPKVKEEPSKTEQVGDSTEVSQQTEAGDVKSEITLSDASFECVVNIARTDGSRYLKIKLEAAYDSGDKGNKNLLVEAASRSSKLKSRAVEYLSGLTLKEVLDQNAQQNIRRDLLREFNKLLPPQGGKFSNVYITEFMVQ